MRTLGKRLRAEGAIIEPSRHMKRTLLWLIVAAVLVIWPGGPPGLFALLGAGAVLAATTQGPISTVVLIMELTGRDRSFILPLLLAAGTATLVARTIESRSIYDARLTDQEIEARRRLRDRPAQ